MVPCAKLLKLQGPFLFLWAFACNPKDELTCKFFASTLHTAKTKYFSKKYSLSLSLQI
jgi:hypothetical protein